MRAPLCIIPAGGQGTRMGPGPPKCLREVRGEPLIRHVVRFWLEYAEQVAVVTQHEAEVSGVLDGFDRASVIYEPHPQGVVAGVLWGLRQVRCPEHFMVALGDCLWDGQFGPMPDVPFCGVAIQAQPESEWGRSYVVGREVGLLEKPHLGLGAYWLAWPHLWALEQHRGIVETMATLEAHTPVYRIVFTGRYLNVTYPEDLERW